MKTNMLKIIVSMMFLANIFCIVGCGSGGGGGDKDFDLYEYLITSDSSLKHWDLYTYSSDGIITTEDNIAQTIEFNSGDIIETSNFGTIAFTGDGISRVNSHAVLYDDNFKDVVKIGDDWFNDCTWTNHFDDYELDNGVIYHDVLELKCNDKLFYFSKYNGNIKVHYSDSENSYNLVVNNIEIKDEGLTIGDILDSYDGDLFSIY